MLSRRLSITNSFPAADRVSAGRLPEWVKDVIDAVFVAVVLATLALVAL
jgi:hypothetical protein